MQKKARCTRAAYGARPSGFSGYRPSAAAKRARVYSKLISPRTKTRAYRRGKQLNDMHEKSRSVSVIVATYNRGATLADTIESVLKSDYPRFELVVVDQTAAG